MARQSRRRTPLSCTPLEARDQPAYVGFDQLAVDSTQYAQEYIIVSQARGTFHANTVVSTAAESLGSGLYRVALADNVTVEQALHYFRGNGYVDFAQPDYRVSVTGTPNDPSYSSLWALNNTGANSGTRGADIGAATAWNFNTGSGSTIVAVIDSGVDYTHPDLAANMWKNTREIAGNGKDDDGNGYKDDIYGYDFANSDANPMDDNGHGTHVAGTIGAVGNNGVGVTGINWRVKIMALKFLDASGNGYLSNAVKAINYAVANGAKIINNSYGGGGYDQAMATAIANARNKGVIFVAAAGNDGANNDKSPTYPANYSLDNIIAVAATDRNDNVASFSNYGRTTVDIAAPGASIYSTLPGNKYGTYSGTSMAAPHVAGALALLWDQHPTWSYRQVLDTLLANTDAVAGTSEKVVTGRLDIGKAMTAASEDGGSTPPPKDTAGAHVTGAVFSGASNSFESVTITFSEPIDPKTFTAPDVNLTGPAGQSIKVQSVTAVAGSGDQQFLVTFVKQTGQGTYRLAMGPYIRDLAGFIMDQNQNGISGESTDVFTTTASIAGKQTLASGPVSQAIKDFGQTVATLVVNQDIAIGDLDVQLDITHTFDNDLRVALLAPDGTKVYLSNRRGGRGDHFTGTIFDDEATTGIASGTAPFTGRFRPETSLSVFDGKNARGTWKIVIDDYALLDTGKLNAWSLTITPGTNIARASAVQAPTTPAPVVALKSLPAMSVDADDNNGTRRGLGRWLFAWWNNKR